MRTIRFAVLSAVAAALLAACSVPVPDQQVDLGLELARVPFHAKRGGFGPVLGIAAEGDMAAFSGTVTASDVPKVEIDSRFTMQSLTLPISLLSEVQVVAPEGGIPPAVYTFTGFKLTAELSDGATNLTLPPVPLPGTFTADLTGDLPTEDFELDLGDNPFLVQMAQGVIDQVNSIIVGTTGTFDFTATLEFSSDLPEETVLELKLDDGEATVRGRGSL